jgi:hypothetical protein
MAAARAAMTVGGGVRTARLLPRILLRPKSARREARGPVWGSFSRSGEGGAVRFIFRLWCG